MRGNLTIRTMEVLDASCGVGVNVCEAGHELGVVIFIHEDMWLVNIVAKLIIL